jgi:3-methylcrotonyl-CoA carboxylase alpha subunit
MSEWLILQLHHDELFHVTAVPDTVLVQAAAYLAAKEIETASTSTADSASLWTSAGLAHRRFGDTLERTYKIDGRDIVVRHQAAAGGGMSVEIDGTPFEGGAPVRGVLHGDQSTELTTHLANTRIEATVIPVHSSTPGAGGHKLHVFTGGRHHVLSVAPSSAEADVSSSAAGAGDTLTAPMPARVLEVKVKEGDEVKEGQVVCVLESMKMEINVRAGRDGVVGKVGAEKGMVVEEGQILVVLAKE